jgi:hypothetical protein
VGFSLLWLVQWPATPASLLMSTTPLG